jgi:hypothetical protein
MSSQQTLAKKGDTDRARSVQNRQLEQAPAVQALSWLLPEQVFEQMPANDTNRDLRQQAVLEMQRSHGNQYVQRMLDRRLDSADTSQARPAVQRENGDEPAPSGGGTPPLTEHTVPVPEPQRRRIEQATAPGEATPAPGAPAAAAPSAAGGGAPAATPAAGTPSAEPPAVPEQARVRAPVDFNFSALPPELQIRFLDEFRFTATVTAARLAWQRDRIRLALGYEYGGALSATGRFGTSAGTFTGSASFDPGSMEGRFGAGWSYERWRASIGATTSGTFSASLGYGAALPPLYTDLSSSVYAGEGGMRNLIGAVPGLFADPASALSLISEHSEDIDAVSGTARTLGRVMDLTDRDASRIDWGVFLRVSGSSGTGIAGTAGAGVMFKRDPESGENRRLHLVILPQVL